MTSGFSELAIELIQSKPRAKKLERPTHIGTVGDEGGGDYVVMEFDVRDGKVQDYGYRCNGCPTTIASSEIVGKLSVGSNFDRIGLIDANIIKKLLGTPFEGKEQIPSFVAGAIKNLKVQERK